MEFSTTFSTLLTKISSLLNADLHYFSRPGFHQAIVMPFDAKGLFFQYIWLWKILNTAIQGCLISDISSTMQ
jgi:hypothetical protein